VYWAVCEGIWCGRGTDKVESGTALAAHESASRAEIAVMVIRYQDKIGG